MLSAFGVEMFDLILCLFQAQGPRVLGDAVGTRAGAARL